jgi:hypothetical protein
MGFRVVEANETDKPRMVDHNTWEHEMNDY